MFEVAYDLAKSPATFDMIDFLVNVERERRARGEDSISLSFVLGDRASSQRDIAFSYERKQWRIQSLLAQFPPLLPSITRTVMGGEGKQEISYHHPLGFEPIFKAPEYAMSAVSEYVRFGKHYVTITLRDSDFQQDRNSNVAEWVKVADWLAEQGSEVVFVPDTEAVLAGVMPDVGKHRCYIPAAMNQSLRLALYEFAMLNCFTSGGPLTLAMWSSAPCLLTKLTHAACTGDEMAAIGYGEQDMPEAFKWITWMQDESGPVIEKLKAILPVCETRLRPLLMPKTFAVMSEDDRKAQAVSALARGYKCFDPVLPHDRTAILCCYGPSLATTAWEVPKLQGDIFTVSGAHDYIAGLGYNIYGHIESDPRPHKARLISRPQGQTKFYMASCCHPDVFDRLQGHDVELWHPYNSYQTDDIIKEIDPTGFIVMGGTNVGLRAMALLTGLGYRKMTILGMDCSFALGGEQHAGFHSGKKQHVMKVHLPDGAWYWTSPQMLQGCHDFFELIPAFANCKIEIKGDGLLQHRLRLTQAQSEKKAA